MLIFFGILAVLLYSGIMKEKNENKALLYTYAFIADLVLMTVFAIMK